MRDWVLYIDTEHFPIRFIAIVQCKASKNLDLLDLTDITHVLTDVKEINRVVVALKVGEVVFKIRAFPRLRDGLLGCSVSITEGLWVSTTYPVEEGVRLMWPNALNKTDTIIVRVVEDRVQWFFSLDLNFPISPSWDLNHEVDDGSVGAIWVERNVMPK
jgi:hypothetical protein